MRTHYQNLKVAENATRDVIKSTYRKLCLKYHPDLNPGNAECQRIMPIINDAYAILSDPVKRRAYDQELALRRAQASTRTRSSRHASASQSAAYYAHPGPFGAATWRNPQAAQGYGRRRPYTSNAAGWYAERSVVSNPIRDFVRRGGITHGMVLIFMFLLAVNIYHFVHGNTSLPFGQSHFPPAPRETVSYTPKPRPTSQLVPVLASGMSHHWDALKPSLNPRPSELSRHTYARPTTAPNGHPWPEESNAIAGYPISAFAGQSRVELDSRIEPSDLFVQLMRSDSGNPEAVRTIFLKAGSAFTLENLTPGAYYLRLRNLDSGEPFKTTPFNLKDPSAADASQTAVRKIRFANPENGGEPVTPISEVEFRR